MYLSAVSSAVGVVALQPGQDTTGVNIQVVLFRRLPNIDGNVDVAAEFQKKNVRHLSGSCCKPSTN